MLEECIQANKEYSRVFDRSKIAKHPAKKLAVVTCMDTRLNIEDFLGLKTGDAHIIRNADGIVTDDEIRSLIISAELGTQDIFFINHTDCGMLTLNEDEMKMKLQQKTGADTSKLRFYPFKDLKANVREQVKRIRDSPFISKEVPVYGLIYHVEDDGLEKVE
ncbi:MAG: carbonic anhydrase [Candidatus Bathyarchaeota archaeon]